MFPNAVLWLHDVVMRSLVSRTVCSHVTSVVVLSRHHAKQLPPHCTPVIIPNAITRLAIGKNTTKNPSSIIFASHPERGLRELLLMWPSIRRRVAHATLDLYHDFPPNYLEEIRRAPRGQQEERREMYEEVVRLRLQVSGG